MKISNLWLISVLVLCGCAGGNRFSIPSHEDQGRWGATIGIRIYRPETGGPFPAVLMMHGCAGLTKATSDSLRGHAEFLVEHGYLAVIVDSFTGRGKSGGMVCERIEEQRFARYYRKIDAYNTLRYLRSLSYVDSRNVFLMGQSQGGTIAFEVADLVQYPKVGDDLRFNAVAAFYPYCERIPDRLRSPLLVLGGEKDDWTPLGTCLAASRRDLGQEYRFIAYEGAYHAFDLEIPLHYYLGFRIGANPVAREDSRRRMLDWFEKFRI